MSRFTGDFSNALNLVKDRLKASPGFLFEKRVEDLLKIIYGIELKRLDADGRNGDGGRDLWYAKTRTIYALYGAKSQEISKTKKDYMETKLKSDFEKALKHNPKTFIFVYNLGNLDYMETECSKLSKENSNIEITCWSVDEICCLLKNATKKQQTEIMEFLDLTPEPFSVEDIEKLFSALKGCFARYREKRSLDFVDLQPNKMEYNQLNDEIKQLLANARQYDGMIDEFVNNSLDTYEPDDIDYYLQDSLGAIQEVYPSEDNSSIFDMLKKQVMNDSALRDSPLSEPLVISFLCYFFMRCIIFENPPADWRAL
jgi:hypothetical protein